MSILPICIDRGKPCKCGCGMMVTTTHVSGPRKDQYRDWIQGHNARGRVNEWSRRPNSTNRRTGRWRARRIVDTSVCMLAHTGQCHGRIEIHHQDKKPINNESSNAIPVCKTHHSFLDRGAITIESPEIPAFWVDGRGKRRYRAG